MNSSNMDFKQTDAIGYSSNGYISFNPSVSFSAGSICSNVIDLFKWDEALINKYKDALMKEHVIQNMQKNYMGRKV